MSGMNYSLKFVIMITFKQSINQKVSVFVKGTYRSIFKTFPWRECLVLAGPIKHNYFPCLES